MKTSKLSADNFKKYSTSMGLHLGPRFGQVIVVSGYPVLTTLMCNQLSPGLSKYSRTSLFRTRLIRSPRYFEGRSNALGFTLPLYASPVISKPPYFELFFHFPWDFEIAGFDCSSFIDESEYRKLLCASSANKVTKTKNL